jgi:catechol 2,3-dioxygenase-like lactoylglutathione lyase family enzyme
MPIRYSDDIDAAVRFYRALGLELGPTSRPGAWVELPATAGLLAIHEATGAEAGACELAFEADERLDDVVIRLRQAGFEPEPIVDENFGQSVRVRDPDGVWVQINSNDRDLYT